MLLDLAASAERARRLRWPSPASLSAFEAALRSSLRGWSEAWGLGLVSMRCEPAWLAAPVGDMHWQPLARSAANETLAWTGAASSPIAERLSTMLFGKPPATSGSAAGATLAHGVAEEAWQAWRAAVAATLSGYALPALDEPSAPPAADSRAWTGAVRVAFTLGTETWVLHVRAAAVEGQEASVTKTGGARAGLRPLTQALARHHVTLQACLQDVRVTLGELMALQAGDVLVTPHALSQPLRVLDSASPAPVLYAAHLAQREGHMALLLAPASTAPSNDRLEGNRMNTTTAQLLGLPEANDPSSAAPAVAAATNPLLGVKTTLQVCVGEAVLTVGELTQARVGQVLKLDREVDGLVDLMLDGRVVARGQLVAVDDCFGVRLSELPLPLSAGGPTGA